MNCSSSIKVGGPAALPEAIDFSRWFMPEELTPLYHTPVYAALTESQRLRYNQLHALYFNEQTMFFEKALARNVLGYFLVQSLSEELKTRLRQFLAEEEHHSGMFHSLNLKCAPAIYAHKDFHFIQVPALASKILHFISMRPDWFPLLLWLMHLQEERALFFGRTFLKFATLLEPHFVAVQRQHLADEIGHVRCDESLLDSVWPETRFLLRWVNSRVFGWMIEEFFSTPKRSALRVVGALAQEFPELQRQYPEFCRELCELENDADYRRSLYCPEIVPDTFPKVRFVAGVPLPEGSHAGLCSWRQHMSAKNYPIPIRLNICLAVLVVSLCLILLWASGRVETWWAVGLLAVAYGFVMNTGYVLCHEAEHDIFHPNRKINDCMGMIISLFFPASFQLRRQGHIGHHLRNRTDDEAFDSYFEGENPVWKYVQFYGILTGFFWLMIVISNFIAVINPKWLAKKTSLDRPTAALQETLNPKYFRLIQLEAALIFLLHGLMIFFFKIPILHYFTVLCGFGFIWSTLQYIHHYGTIRDVHKGALNLRTWRLFDLIWLNHHWHLNHHLHPTVSWIYLPKLQTAVVPPSLPFWKAYLRQWRGPRFTSEHLTNQHAGKLIR